MHLDNYLQIIYLFIIYVIALPDLIVKAIKKEEKNGFTMQMTVNNTIKIHMTYM
jgi:hypothetical protein